MKKAVFQTASVLIGAFIGAGFISGGEIAAFFCGKGNLFCRTYLAFLLFFLIISELFYIGNRYGGYALFNRACFCRFQSTLNLFYGLCALISCGAMLAGTDSLFSEYIGINLKFPLFPLSMLATAFFVSVYGVKLLSKVNAVLVPLMIVGVLYIVFSQNSFSAEGALHGEGVVSCYLYVAMNLWFSAPLIVELGKGKSQRQNLAAAFVTSAVICLIVLFIASAICGAGQDALNSSMPLVYLASGTPIKKYVYIFIVLAAIFTTLCSSLVSAELIFVKGKYKKIKRVAIPIAVFMFSLIGFSSIVEKIYPLVGAFGLLYFALSAIKLKSFSPYKTAGFTQK